MASSISTKFEVALFNDSNCAMLKLQTVLVKKICIVAIEKNEEHLENLSDEVLNKRMSWLWKIYF